MTIRILTYMFVGIIALGLTLASNQIERDYGRVEQGFPFVNVAPLHNTIDMDIFNLPGFLGNIVVYSVLVLTGLRVVQSVYTERVRRSLRYLLPSTGVVGLFCVAASMGYNPFPSHSYQPPSSYPTSTPVPAHVSNLIRRWSGTDATTGQPITLQFDNYNATLVTPDGEFKGAYNWITPERLVIRLGRYIGLGTGTESPACPTLPTVFNVACYQQIASGYPAPMVVTPVPQRSEDPYPAPLPTEMVTNALYQGIEAEYRVVMSRTHLTLTAPTGEVQSFTVTPLSRSNQRFLPIKEIEDEGGQGFL